MTARSWTRWVRDQRIPWRPVDEVTAGLLEHLALSEDHGLDVATVCEAIAHTARDHDGAVDMNQVRARLWDDERGRYTVSTPQLVGATVSHLARAGVLRVDGVNLNTDKRGGNAGKPQRTYRMDVPDGYRWGGLHVTGPARPGAEDNPGAMQEEARATAVYMGQVPTRAELAADEDRGTLW